MKPGEIVEVTQAELDELLRLAKASFPAPQYGRLEQVLASFVSVMMSLQNAKISIKRLRQMVFGARTEHRRNVLAEIAADDDAHGPDAAAAATVDAAASAGVAARRRWLRAAADRSP